MACPPGLLGYPGPLYCLPGPQYCLSWPPGLLQMFPRALQVPPQAASTLQFCSPLRHFSHFLNNCFFGRPNALGLPFGRYFGPLERLLSQTSCLLGAFQIRLAAARTPLGPHLGPLGCLLGSPWAPLGDLGPNVVPSEPFLGLALCLLSEL